jgi:predicted DCC family thiol-disulfide oxidoreductase YuxK
MTRLYLLYDARCSLCRRLCEWVVRQTAFWPVVPVAAGSEEARALFPEIEPGELTVVASDGRFWRGDHAWLIVLFALKEYRGWATRLSSPAMLPLARQAFATLSGYRDVCEL